MKFLVVVKARLSKPFSHWVAAFDADREARFSSGVEDLFRYPVIGEQCVVFAMRTESPRLVHDMMYDERVRPGIESSGLVIGSEQITVCEAI